MPAAKPNATSIDIRVHAMADNEIDRLMWDMGEPALLREFDNGARDGMARVLAERSDHGRRPFFVDPGVQRTNVRDLERVVGQRAGLIENDRVDPGKRFDRGSALDQTAFLRGPIHRRLNRDRRACFTAQE